MTQEQNPVTDQDHKNEDDEFKRIENENKWREEQLKKVRSLKPVVPKAMSKPNYIPKNNMMRKVGRGR